MHCASIELLCNLTDVSVTVYTVSERGQMALPAAARRRWGLTDGGQVEVVDLGDTVMIAPAGPGGFRAMVRDAIEEAGGFEALVAAAVADDPDLQ